MNPKQSTSLGRRAIAASTTALALLSFTFLGLSLSGCGGDDGSGDSNFSQKFENPQASPGSGQAGGSPPLVTPADNPDNQTAKARRAQDREEGLKGKR